MTSLMILADGVEKGIRALLLEAFAGLPLIKDVCLRGTRVESLAR